MLTDVRLEANSQNAKLSTGAKTAKGKAKSSRNNVRHGIYPVTATFPTRVPNSSTFLSQGLLRSLEPPDRQGNRGADADIALGRTSTHAEHGFECTVEELEAWSVVAGPAQPLKSPLHPEGFSMRDLDKDLIDSGNYTREQMHAIVARDFNPKAA
jgi:hypothetical protein